MKKLPSQSVLWAAKHLGKDGDTSPPADTQILLPHGSIRGVYRYL